MIRDDRTGAIRGSVGTVYDVAHHGSIVNILDNKQSSLGKPTLANERETDRESATMRIS